MGNRAMAHGLISVDLHVLALLSVSIFVFCCRASAEEIPGLRSKRCSLYRKTLQQWQGPARILSELVVSGAGGEGLQSSAGFEALAFWARWQLRPARTAAFSGWHLAKLKTTQQASSRVAFSVCGS